MELKILGIAKKDNSNWVNLHCVTTTTPYGVQGVAVKTVNITEDRLPSGYAIGSILDVNYGCRFDGKAFIESITLKKGGN